MKEEVPNIPNSLTEQDVNRLLEMIKTIRYGSITIVIQDGKVVQFDKNEKHRLI